MTKKALSMLMMVATALGLSTGAFESFLEGPLGRHRSGLAQAQEPPSTPPTPPPAVKAGTEYEHKDTRSAKDLSLRDAIEAAVANNLDVAISRKNPESARYGVIQQRAFFDPLLDSSATYGKSKNEPLSDFSSKGNRFWAGSVTLSQILQEGFSYSANWTSSKARTIYPPAASSLGFFDPVSPTYNSGLNLQFNQPLLRGAGFDVNRTEIEIARLDVGTNEQQFRGTVIDTIGAAERAYWNLTAAIANFDVQQQSLSLAQDLLTLNRKKVEVGTLAPIQITEAEASVASREQGVILAEADIRNAEDNLRRIMNLPPDSPEWNMALKPTDPPPFEPIAINLEASLKEALEGRPDVIQARNDVRTLDLRYRFAQNARKPQLDAFANYNPSGNNYTPGKVQVGDFNGDGTLEERLKLEGLGASASEVFKNNVYDWSVGLRFSIPIGNRNAKATEARSHIALEQAQMTLENVERNVQVEVRTAVRAVETFKKSVDAARSNVVLQRKKLEAEQKRYENGMSTSFQVLTFQNDLTSALSQEIASITAYNNSLVALGVSTAALPAQRHVTIVMPGPVPGGGGE